ncbi:hypothetical protein [Clostridium sp. FP1]|nr:hypothetical protein [Clostridium sp. FP1]MBZ9637585.1 hypothetical protein [Clostridium sp. FP1]
MKYFKNVVKFIMKKEDEGKISIIISAILSLVVGIMNINLGTILLALPC